MSQTSRQSPARLRTTASLIGACHPEPTAAVTIFAVALTASTGRPPWGVVAAGAAVLSGQLSVGWHNDWLDVERDRRAGRTDKPVARGAVSRRTVGWAGISAAACAVPLSFISGWRAALAHIAALLLAWAYNAGLKSTRLSVLPYAVSFPLLVAFVTLGGPASPWPPWWALATASLLGCGAHLLNAVPDLTDDEAAGVRGLPHRLGRSRSVAAAMTLLVAGTIVVDVGPGHPGWADLGGLGGGLFVVAVSVALGRQPGSRWLFRGAMLVALIDVVGLVAQGNV